MEGMMTISIAGNGYAACLVIDSIVNNTSSGGVRIAEEISPAEVAALAREMTLKYATYRLPRGGAKTGVSIPARVSRKEKDAILNDLGRKLGPIIRNGIYNPGMDMNCGPDDLRAVYAGAGIAIGGETDTSFFTALSVESALEAYYDELGLSGTLSVAVEGFGRVAGHLAARLPPERYRIAAISTLAGAVRSPNGFDLRVLAAKRNELGDEVVKQVSGEMFDKEELLMEAVDVLIPSSRTWMIHSKNVDAIEAKAIVPIANAPYGEGTIAHLNRKSILCLPGYVTNGGGVFGSSLYDVGFSVARVEELTRRWVQPAMSRLIGLSRRLGVPATELAEQAVEREISIREKAPPIRGRLAKAIARLKQYLPKAARRQKAEREFIESMASLAEDLKSAATLIESRANRAGNR
jgi:glutamate dehydrogenase (NAD(P)+)